MKKVILIGAGEAGNIVFNHQADFGFKVEVWLDDDISKHPSMKRKVKNVGSIDSLPRHVSSHETVIVAIANANRRLLRKIREMTGEHQLLVMPPVYLQLKDLFPAEPLRPYGIEDLLARPKRKIDLASTRTQLKGSVVLIAGAGGSIGGELAKLVSVFGCQKLILIDIDENGLEEIRAKSEGGTDVEVESCLCDLKNMKHLRTIFRSHPDIVFDCAAHKHVSAGQRNPSEVVYNNLVSTRNILDCCSQANTKKFIFISTDKSVKPTSAMGSSKTLCESLVLAHERSLPAKYIVRFGNVLNSRGSVLRIWEGQLHEGFVLTVTDHRMKRYAMSISEACQLLLKSMEFESGTYVLDMGPQITVDALLDAFLRSKEKTRSDVRIKITGRKPGEKLAEDLFWPQETYEKTPHSGIFRVRNTPVYDFKKALEISRQYDDSATINELRRQFKWLET